MKGYCDVCKDITEFYNAFGSEDKAVVCRVCMSPTDRKELKKQNKR